MSGLLTCWLVATLAASVPLVGTVEDPSGSPLAGASVFFADTFVPLDGITQELLGSAVTDARGQFRIERVEALAGRGASWSPTVWAYLPGHRVGFVEFKRHIPTAAEPVRLVVGPPARTPIRVNLPDNQPAAGAIVRPYATHFRAPRPPGVLLDQLTVTTDAAGRAVMDGLGPADVAGLDVTATGFVIQAHPFTPQNPEPKLVTLRPVGRLVIRLTGPDPNALAGWHVTAWTSPDNGAGWTPATSWVREPTDAQGRAEMPPCAAGRITWRIQPPPVSLDMAEDPLGVVVRAGATTEVTIPIRRATRVVGSVLEAGTGKPLARVRVNTRCLAANLSTDDPLTDDAGRFAYRTLPGKNNTSLDHRTIPATHFLPPGAPWFTEFTVPEGVTEHTLAPIELSRAVLVRGQVVDEAGRGVPGVDVSGNWSAPAFEGPPGHTEALTDEHGNFILGQIAPGAAVSIAATIELRAKSVTRQITAPGLSEAGAPVVLTLEPVSTRAVAGRVVGPDGRAVGGAEIRVRVRSPQSPIDDGRELPFAADHSIRTDPDGTFTIPPVIPTGWDYRIGAEAAGFTANDSPWVGQASRDPVVVHLLRLLGSRSIAGRVLDSSGAPVAGVEVFQAGDGPARTQSITDPAGRFEVAGVADDAAFLFARHPAYRFSGRIVAARDQTADLVVTPRDAPPPARLVAIPPAAGPTDRAIALDLISPDQPDHPAGGLRAMNRPPRVETLALLDPDLVTVMIANQVVAPTPSLIAALVAHRVADRPAEAFAFIDTFEPDMAARAYLAVQAMWAEVLPVESTRDLLDRAARQVDRVVDRADDRDARYAHLLELAGAWYAAGQVDQGGKAARAAQAIARSAPKPPDWYQPGLLGEALAPVDLPAALRLLEQDAQPFARDQNRRRIVRRAIMGDPTPVRPLVDAIEEPRLKAAAGTSLATRLAATGQLALARTLAPTWGVSPTAQAMLPATAADPLDPARGEEARALLAESFERLGVLAGDVKQTEISRERGLGPLGAMAGLLPLAVRLDPDRAREYLWLTLASRPPRSTELEHRPVLPWTRQHYLNLEVLALRIAPYDRAAAEVVIAPALERIPLFDDSWWGLGPEGRPLFATAAAFDGVRARSMWQALPADPPQLGPNGMIRSDHPVGANARGDIAWILALPPPLRTAVALRAID